MSSTLPMTALRLDGGILCLDFINTIDNRFRESGIDYLTGYHQLLEWHDHVRVIPSKLLQTLQRLGKSYPAQAALVFERSLQLREVLYQLFTTIIAKKSPAAPELQAFNNYVTETLAHVTLVYDKGARQGNVVFTSPVMEQVMWWVVQSALTVWTSEQLLLIRQCPACGWLFMDRSKNRSRKWCSMETCGGLDKVKACYERKKKQDKKPSSL